MALIDDTGAVDLALSLSRYLATAFDGNAVVRLREDNTDTEQDFKLNGSNVLVTDDVNEDTVSTWLTDNGAGTPAFITDWYDQSGNTRDYQQNTLLDQPKLEETGTNNSLATVRFERVAGLFLTSVASYEVTEANGLFIAVVFQSLVSTRAMSIWGDPNSSTMRVLTATDAEYIFFSDAGGQEISGGTVVQDADAVVVFESVAANPGNHIIRVDGTLGAGPTSLTMDARSGTHALGSQTSAGSGFGDFFMAEFLQVNGTKTFAQRSTIENSLGDQFGITIAGPIFTTLDVTIFLETIMGIELAPDIDVEIAADIDITTAAT